jgi:hypothetical protein
VQIQYLVFSIYKPTKSATVLRNLKARDLNAQVGGHSRWINNDFSGMCSLTVSSCTNTCRASLSDAVGK